MNDSLDEPQEDFYVNLSSPQEATVLDAQGRARILDDDSPPTLNLGNATAIEGNALQFTLSLSEVSGRPLTATYVLSNGPATGGAGANDYTGSSPVTLTFTPGQHTKTITVSSTHDTTDKVHEIFYVTLTDSTYSYIGDGQGIGTITDNDGPAISVNNVLVTEGEGAYAAFTISLSAPSPQQVTVAWSTASGSAVEPGDYGATGGVVTFAANQTTQTVSVPLLFSALRMNQVYR